jgi:uncharacterized protein (DUF934 family)
MPLIKQGRRIDDPFVQVADGAPLPAEGPIIVSLARWQEEQGLIAPRNAAIGIRLKPSDPIGQIAADLGRFDVIALEFPKFNDGRAMSQARLLRERHGYRGEIRATGRVLRDLLLFMHRCGIDAFEVADDIDVEVVARSLAVFSHYYQPAVDGKPSVLTLRRGPAKPAAVAASTSLTAAVCDKRS